MRCQGSRGAGSALGVVGMGSVGFCVGHCQFVGMDSEGIMVSFFECLVLVTAVDAFHRHDRQLQPLQDI